MLPQEVENKCINKTIEKNGEMLNYTKEPVYSELVLDDYEMQGVYYISNGEKELSQYYDKAKKVAEERGLPLIERDISKYRTEQGLEPIQKENRRSFFDNILYKYCNENKELKDIYFDFGDKFTSNKNQEFYEKYIKLKEQITFQKKAY